MQKLDAIDRELLQLLQADAKTTHKELAAKLGLTISPIFERVKRLEKAGIIRQYTALIDRRKSGLELLAFCNVSLKEHARPFLLRFESEILQFPEVQECHHIAGPYDYLLKVVVADLKAYQHFISEKLAGLENIGQVMSALVMKEIKNTPQVSLPKV
ncbi:MAG: Lrp/AsnC family transcriptional regulator [Bacteroidota bacterium]